MMMIIIMNERGRHFLNIDCPMPVCYIVRQMQKLLTKGLFICLFIYILLSFCDFTAEQHEHTHSVLMAILPGEPVLAGCPLNSPSPFIPGLHTFWDRPKRFMSFLTQSNQVFLGILSV